VTENEDLEPEPDIRVSSMVREGHEAATPEQAKLALRMFQIRIEQHLTPDEYFKMLPAVMKPSGWTLPRDFERRRRIRGLGLPAPRRRGPTTPYDELAALEAETIIYLVFELRPGGRETRLSDLTYKEVADVMQITEAKLRRYALDESNPVEKPKELARRLYPQLKR
jgi:hypothetical protein